MDLEKRNSRVILAVGEKAFAAIQNFKVGVIGLSPTGCEIVKNLALTGVGSISILDSKVVTNLDIGANFFLRNKDIGKTRCDALIKRFEKMNPKIEITFSDAEWSEEWITSVDSLILAELLPYSDVLKISKVCHDNNVQFIWAATFGPCSVLFEDFGDKFICESRDGQPPAKAVIKKIVNGRNVYLENYSKDAVFPVGSVVKFEDVEALPEINNREGVVKTLMINGYIRVDAGEIKDCTFNADAKHGTMTEVIPPVEISHKDLSLALENGISNANTGPISAAYPHVRNLMLEICKFADEHKKMPELLNEADAEEIASKVGMDKDLAKRIVMCSAVEYPPNSGVVGGAAAQEAMKFVSKTFTPTLEQWFVVDHSKVCNWTEVPTLQGDRYDPIVAVIGNTAMAKVRSTKALICGIGAIGCEIVRYGTLFGFNKMILIDHDSVEPSNLTRQFLFRDKHRGKHKAVVGRDAALKANSDLKPDDVIAFTCLFQGETITSLPFTPDIVFSAVDSVKARKFISEYCWLRNIPMTNGGMNKVVADFQVYIPFRTRPFSMQEQKSDAAPPCTVKLNPTLPVHLIQWAHNEFIGSFQETPQAAHACMRDYSRVSIKLKKGIKLLLSIPKTFEDCVQWAYNRFTRRLEYMPRMLLAGHSDTALDTNGRPYWEGKTKPIPVEFDTSNEWHMMFLTSAARMKARLHSIDVTDADIANIKSIAEKCTKPACPLDKVNEKNYKVVDFTRLRAQLREVESTLTDLSLDAIEFDKDDEVHMDFVEGFARSRAKAVNIDMSRTSRLEIMKKAGGIAPTLATTTSIVGGGIFSGVPIIVDDTRASEKLQVDGDASLIGLHYRKGGSICPGRVRKIPNSTEKFSVWDLIDVHGNPTMKEIFAKYEDPLELDEPAAWTTGTGAMIPLQPDMHICEAVEKACGYKSDVYILYRSAFDFDNNKDILLPHYRIFVD